MSVTTTRSGYLDLLREQLHAALEAGVVELVCADVDFADWPWNEPSLLEALTRWAAPHRRLVLLAHTYDTVHRRHPRFVQWRRTWGHVVHAWTRPDLEPGDHPTCVWSPQRVVEALDRPSWRARASDDPADVQRWRHLLDAHLQRSEPAFAATTLGL